MENSQKCHLILCSIPFVCCVLCGSNALTLNNFKIVYRNIEVSIGLHVFACFYYLPLPSTVSFLSSNVVTNFARCICSFSAQICQHFTLHTAFVYPLSTVDRQTWRHLHKLFFIFAINFVRILRCIFNVHAVNVYD